MRVRRSYTVSDTCLNPYKIASSRVRVWGMLQFRQVSKKQQEIADAVGVTQKTVDNRLESLVNLDRCPKLLKIAALFEDD